ncbi:hypothetical protein BUZ69_10790 [Staphylococcus saprophyticus]|uniref:hypothetical protein n=1 Tax=Staphylococcus saprophyticus TaxID=29385 RepID=UPI000D1EC459|nr:hypothetical protein [Staphylococcus saprophyticus]PTK45337.1 hypothetical protein BUZ69_10790 [Staphylococcus saprophyticus]
MNKMDRLQEIVNEAFGEKAVILDSTDNKALVKFEKGDNVEYVVTSYNEKGCYGGHYFTQFSSENPKTLAWKVYKDKINVSSI